jgi:hypothetical protein
VARVDIAPMPGTRGSRLIAQVADLAGGFEQHYRDAGHVDVEDYVAVKVHTLHLN